MIEVKIISKSNKRIGDQKIVMLEVVTKDTKKQTSKTNHIPENLFEKFKKYVTNHEK